MFNQQHRHVMAMSVPPPQPPIHATQAKSQSIYDHIPNNNQLQINPVGSSMPYYSTNVDNVNQSKCNNPNSHNGALTNYNAQTPQVNDTVKFNTPNPEIPLYQQSSIYQPIPVQVPKQSSGAPSPNGYSVNSSHNNIYQSNSRNLTPRTQSDCQSISSSDITDTNDLMPINVKGMLLHGVSGHQVIKAWLKSIKCEEYTDNFINNGYDMHLLVRMTPQDLAAIGCKSPNLRKKLLSEIKKLNLEDQIPCTRPHSLDQWLDTLKLREYRDRLCQEGFDTIDKLCEISWEDLEDIGITKLGHQKKLLLAVERVKRFDKLQEERTNDHSIYDVHPNHRISLHQNHSDSKLNTISRSARSGFFQTKSRANLDHRGLPMVPALKHVTSNIASLDIGSRNNNPSNNGLGDIGTSAHCDNGTSQSETIYQSTTIKRHPPPLPPVRTNSLKFPFDPSDYSDNIYGNYDQSSNGINLTQNPSNNPTTFLRTPKLGALTSTTNKMLTHGGYIQTVNDRPTTMTSIVPIREAPAPPLSSQTTSIYNEATLDNTNTMRNFSMTSVDPASAAMIGHQLASADEFPPPPPS